MIIKWVKNNSKWHWWWKTSKFPEIGGGRRQSQKVDYCIKSGAQSGRNSGTDNRRLFLARNRRLLCRNRRLLYIQKMQMMPAGGFELWTIRWRKFFAFLTKPARLSIPCDHLLYTYYLFNPFFIL